LDMGLARFTRERRDAVEISQTNNSVGTAEYMAPEQALDAKHVDIRADVYALGGTLYRCLTGEVPFAGLSALQTMMRKLEATPPSVRTLRPEVPEALSAIVDKMLATRPEDRFDTPGAVALALAPFCAMGEGDASVSTISTREAAAKTQIVPRPSMPSAAATAVPPPATRGAAWKYLVVGLIAAALGAAAFFLLR
ncbi:MAG TPA: protein kinase, partial [Pirellulales bacterium]